MKKFNILFVTVILGFMLLVIVADIALYQKLNIEQNEAYKVVLNRIEQEIRLSESEKDDAISNVEELNDENVFKMQRNFGVEIVDIESVDIVSSDGKTIAEWLNSEEKTNYLFSTETTLYKITYRYEGRTSEEVLWYFNGIVVILLSLCIAVFIHIRQNILKPFFEFSDMPFELAKGNLTKPIKENKNKYFGRFLWGMNLLREHMEESRQKELELQKENKVLLISLSHDIKTPLNAISLYAKAISRNLYKEEEKKREVAENIHTKVGEIEAYMAEIVKASNEEFMNFEVTNGEFYSREVFDTIADYYADKMELNQIEFMVEEYPNCLLFGDRERVIEVLQNLIENAIKYGDGRRIVLKAVKSEEAYEIFVCNTGCTMDKVELTHIFDSFYRGSNVGKQKGSGLGLFICRKLMHLMDGEILADILQNESGQVMQVKVILRYI